MSPSLEESTFDQIMEELENRYGSALLCISRTSIKDENMTSFKLAYRGNWLSAIGMASFAHNHLLTDKNEEVDFDEF